jgi:hypothetical protein
VPTQPDATGLNVSGLMRDYLVRAGVPFALAAAFAEEFDGQVKAAAWLRTFDGTTFTRTFNPTPTPL